MAGKEESLSLKPCCGARRGAEEEEDALKPCSHRDGSKNLDGFSLKPWTTTSTTAAAAFASNEFQLKQRTTHGIICSTKRKVPTDGHDEEDTALADSVTTEQAIKVAGADSEVDSSDDDDEPVSEAEFAAFYEEEKAKHERFYIERVLPLELKNASLLQRQCKAESVLESN